MRIILAHNFYLLSGGEDRVFSDEFELLRERGHKVFQYVDDNKRIEKIEQEKIELKI